MKKLLLYIVVCNCFISASAQDYLIKRHIIGADTLEVLYGDSIIYMMQDHLSTFGVDQKTLNRCIVLRKNGVLLPKNHIFQLPDKQIKLQFIAVDTSIIKFNKPNPFNSPGFFKVLNEGQTAIGVVIEQDTLFIPLHMQAVYIESRFAPELVNDFLGKATAIINRSISYGKTLIVDGLQYDATKAIRGLQATHWHYASFPRLIVQFNPPGSSFSVQAQQAGWQQLEELIQQTY